MTEDEEDTHTHSYNSCTCGSWAQRVSELVRKDGSGIPPEYELEFKATSDAVSKSRAKKHKQHYRESKCGSRPWATFVFHYRSKAAIDEADCELSPKTSAELEPADPESFVKGSTDSAKRRKPAKSASEHDETNPMMSGEHGALMTLPPPEPMLTPFSDQLWESNEFIEPRTPATTSSNPLFLTPPPLPKKKKKPEGSSGHTGNAASPPLFERKSMAQDAVPLKTSPQPQSFSSFNRENEMKEEADGRPGEQSLDHPYIMTDEELAQAVAAAEAFLDPTSRAQDEAMEAQVLLPPFDQSYMNSETEAGCLTASDIAEFIPPEGIKLKDLKTQFTEEDLPNTLQAKGQFLQLVRGIANNTKDVYFLKPSRQVGKAHLDSPGQQSQQKSRSSFYVNQSSFQDEKVSTLEPDYNRRTQEPVDEKFLAPEKFDSFNHKAASEPLKTFLIPENLPQQTLHQQRPHSHSQTSVKPTIEGTPTAPQHTSISETTSSPTNDPHSLPRNSPATAAADTISSYLRPGLTPELPHHLTGALKRSASTMTAPRESPPSSKKPKFDELATRKLALQKSLAEKKARKAEARRAFEELQKRREQEEQRRIEAEEREIAMLERMAADEEEEYTELVEATEAEEAAIAEAKLARERAEEAVRLSEGP
ncbi:hypothetical protein KC316_g6091 [Hortaea werneckii]|nr:hypothetical protein KC324_g6160 [Hortaea werneckii]KAI7585581.1 hypothetical protein KC316_g6091 [Hortaea werneckii]